jgi:hypothetical protein
MSVQAVKAFLPDQAGKIDFARLKPEFKLGSAKSTTVHTHNELVEGRRFKMVTKNPARTDFQDNF